MISHPFQLIPFRTACILVIVFAIATLLIASKLNKISQPLTISGISPHGILSLEFAFTEKKLKILSKLGARQMF